MSQESNFVDMSGWRADRPYNSLPALPPAVELETKAVLKQCATSREAVGRLSKAVELIPNPSILINTIPLLEAQASSEIENIVTTADRLFQYLSADRSADPATKEALRYRHALLEGFELLESGTRPLNASMAETICSRIKGVDMRVRKVPGTALANQATGKIIYTPPEGETTIRDLLSNWERFVHSSDDLDPLVRMAVAHYQFEAIHPFADGNGRTGRVLNILLLTEAGLLPLPILYLSRFIIENKSDYYRFLGRVTERNEWIPWLQFMLRGVEDTATWTTDKIGAIRDLADEVAANVRTKAPKIYSRELIDVIFEQPYCRIENVVRAGIVARQAASRHLKRLAEVEVLIERKVGREKLFLNPRLLQLLTGMQRSG